MRWRKVPGKAAGGSAPDPDGGTVLPHQEREASLPALALTIARPLAKPAGPQNPASTPESGMSVIAGIS